MQSVKYCKINKKAFTLIEILLVVVLISVISAIALPNFGPVYRDLQLRRTVDDIVYLMRYTQTRAITKGVVCQINFDPVASTYWLTQQTLTDTDKEDEARFDALPGRWGRIFHVMPPVQLDPKLSHVEFSPDGRIEKIKFSVCLKRKCLTISTQEQRGYVDILEENSEDFPKTGSDPH